MGVLDGSCIGCDCVIHGSVFLHGFLVESLGNSRFQIIWKETKRVWTDWDLTGGVVHPFQRINVEMAISHRWVVYQLAGFVLEVAEESVNVEFWAWQDFSMFWNIRWLVGSVGRHTHRRKTSLNELGSPALSIWGLWHCRMRVHRIGTCK